MDGSKELLERWSQGFGLHVEGVVFGDGKVILCECLKIKKEGKTSVVVSLIGDSTVASILQYDPDPWVQLTEMDRHEIPGRGLVISCGEGAMGNEGYIAVCEQSTNRLVQFAFFTCSNPFTSVRYEKECVVAENSREEEWSFSLGNLQEITIRD